MINIEIFEPNKNKLKPINLQLRMLEANGLNNPSLVCTDDMGNYICTLLFFHAGRGGMHPKERTKQTLESMGYDISGLQFDSQGAIRFKIDEDWEIKQ